MNDKAVIAKLDTAAAHWARGCAKQGELGISMHTNGNDLRYISVIFPQDADRNSVGLMLQRAGKLLMDGEL